MGFEDQKSGGFDLYAQRRRHRTERTRSRNRQGQSTRPWWWPGRWFCRRPRR